ncbi:MAG TPA: hypothetical protein VN709_09415 [Terriglobales bacterium]|nr:hypothetical protein [Terriglobales bacterium]
MKPKAFVAWSSGKDSAWALYETQRQGDVEVVGILTTVSEAYSRVAMHGVRCSLLERQALALGLGCLQVPIPSPCSNEIYEQRMGVAIAELKKAGISRMIFGDLFLADIRAYRERQMEGTGIEAVFPLWLRDTRALANEMIDSGLVAHIACLDPRHLDQSFAGRQLDRDCLAALPAAVDPCGENGEFHTVVTAGPMFNRPVATERGETVERDGFVFTDFL